MIHGFHKKKCFLWTTQLWIIIFLFFDYVFKVSDFIAIRIVDLEGWSTSRFHLWQTRWFQFPHHKLSVPESPLLTYGVTKNNPSGNFLAIYWIQTRYIKSTNKVKYLGVIIDNSLSGDSAVDSIVKKVNCRLKFLYRQARFLDVKCKMSLCSALVQCHLDYACSAWYSGLSKLLKHRLQVCQNKMVRFILDMSPRDSINYNVLSSIQIWNIEDRVKQLRLNHVYNIFNDRAPSYLWENFVLKAFVWFPICRCWQVCLGLIRRWTNDILYKCTSN